MYISLEAPTGPMVSNLNFAQEQTSKNSWLRGRCDSMSYLGGGSRMKKKNTFRQQVDSYIDPTKKNGISSVFYLDNMTENFGILHN